MHLFSIALHLINVCLIMLIAADVLRKLDKSRIYPTAAVMGLIYGLHPALIEPVSFISTRFDMMMTSFLLTALFADTRIEHHWWRAFAVGFLFLLGALSKEMAVGFAIALPIWHFLISGAEKINWHDYFKRIKSRGDLKVYFAIFISGIVYLYLRYQALGHIYDSNYNAGSTDFTPLQHIALFGMSIFKYLALLLFPLAKINVAHPLPNPIGPDNVQVILGYALLVGIPAIAWMSKANRVAIIAGFALVLAGLLPVTGIIPLPRNPGMYFSESFLPFPMALFVLVLAKPINKIVNPQPGTPREIVKAARGGLSVWLLLALFTVWSTIPVWNNNITLWLWAKSANPHNLQVSNNLSAAYVVAKRYTEAVDEAKAGVKLDENDDFSWNNLALGLNGLGRFQRAEYAAKRAIKLDPEETRNRVTLARIYYFSKNYKAALESSKSILKVNPDDISTLVLIANVYKETGKTSQARKFMQMAIAKLPAGQERLLLRKWLENL
ncbi:MAG: tetratricopeptide repeat protein [Acidiferrobacterales bacterium]